MWKFLFTESIIVRKKGCIINKENIDSLLTSSTKLVMDLFIVLWVKNISYRVKLKYGWKHVNICKK